MFSQLLSQDQLLNDYLSPSQSCIKPVTIKKSEKYLFLQAKQVTRSVRKEEVLELAKITLEDCLACR